MKKIILTLLITFISNIFAVTYYNSGSSKVYVTEWNTFINSKDTMSHNSYIDTLAYNNVHMLSDSGGVNICYLSHYDTTTFGTIDTIIIDPFQVRSFTVWGYGKQLKIWLNDTLSTNSILTSGLLYMECYKTVRLILVTADESYPYEVQCFTNLNQLKGK